MKEPRQPLYKTHPVLWCFIALFAIALYQPHSLGIVVGVLIFVLLVLIVFDWFRPDFDSGIRRWFR